MTIFFPLAAQLIGYYCPCELVGLVCAIVKSSFSVVFWVKDHEKDLVGSGKKLNSTLAIELIRLIRSHLGELFKKFVSSSDRAPSLGKNRCADLWEPGAKDLV